MPVDRTQLIAEQSLFYRNNYRRLLTATLVLMVIVFILIGLLFYEYSHRPVIKSFATTSSGQVIEINPAS